MSPCLDLVIPPGHSTPPWGTRSPLRRLVSSGDRALPPLSRRTWSLPTPRGAAPAANGAGEGVAETGDRSQWGAGAWPRQCRVFCGARPGRSHWGNSLGGVSGAGREANEALGARRERKAKPMGFWGAAGAEPSAQWARGPLRVNWPGR